MEWVWFVTQGAAILAALLYTAAPDVPGLSFVIRGAEHQPAIFYRVQGLGYVCLFSSVLIAQTPPVGIVPQLMAVPFGIGAIALMLAARRITSTF
jgi:hypothetical protein